MCVVAIAWEAHPRWRLIVAGNRDELHARASAPLAPWDDAPHVLAGRDLVAGGGWIGVSDEGRMAVVTNAAARPRTPESRSRGDLVADFLRTGALPDARTFDDYGGFSLITVDNDGAAFRTNHPASASRTLPAGIHGISNGPLDEPWARTLRLTAAVGAADAADPVDHLLDMLGPRGADSVTPGTGDPRGYPVFIRNPVYGTRCSTVIAIDRSGTGTIVERRFDAAAVLLTEIRLSFRWPLRSAAASSS